MADDVPTDTGRRDRTGSASDASPGDTRATAEAAGPRRKGGRTGSPGLRWPAALVVAACVSLLVGGTHSAAQQSSTATEAAPESGQPDATDAGEPGAEDDGDAAGAPEDATSHSADGDADTPDDGATGDTARPGAELAGESGPVLDPYETTDTELTYRTWVGVCADYRVVAEESADAVVLSLVSESEADGPTACTAQAVAFEGVVELAEPVGDRTVRDEEGEELSQR